MVIKKQDTKLEEDLKGYRPHKERNVEAQDFMEKTAYYVSEGRLERFEQCGTFLEFVANKARNKHKLVGANFCRDRFCPMCQWRLALKNSYALTVVMRAMEDREKVRYIFLTLTAPNVLAGELDAEIKRFNRGFSSLMQQVNYKRTRIQGYVRKLEVTYNENSDTYHPHIHAVLAVRSYYFTNPSYYLSQDRWLELWQKVMKDDSISQVNVKAIKPSEIENSTVEISKYAVKSQDFLYSQKVFDVFFRVLKGKRLLSYGGLFKEYRQLFKQGKLVGYEDMDETEYVYEMMMKWQPDEQDYKKNYQLMDEVRRQELEDQGRIKPIEEKDYSSSWFNPDYDPTPDDYKEVAKNLGYTNEQIENLLKDKFGGIVDDVRKV